MIRRRPVSLAQLKNGPELIGVDPLDVSLTRRFLEVFVLTLGLSSIVITIAMAALLPASGGSLQQDATQLRAKRAALPVETDLCPAGWELRYAAALGSSEQDIRDWVAQEALVATDAEVIRVAGLHLTAPFPSAGTPTLTQAQEQVLLCIAQSRGLTAQPVR